MELERARNRAGLGLWAGKTWAHSSLDGTDWAHCEGDVEGRGLFFRSRFVVFFFFYFFFD